MKDFAVTSKSFALYEAFKKEAELKGWIYNHKFTPFTEDQMQDLECLYFSNYDWETHEGDTTTPLFAFSNPGDDNKVFHLEIDWNEAIKELMLDTIVCIPPSQKTHVTLQQIADWKGVSINDLTIGL